MSRNKKIGIIMPEISDMLDYELLEGMYSQAKKLGVTLLIFTGVYNTRTEQEHNVYRKCLDNIYQFPMYGSLDGIVFVADKFKSEYIQESVYELLSGLDVPKISLNQHRDGFTSVYPMQKEGIYQATKHLINVHHAKKLYCITGIPDEHISTERLSGFYQAMNEAGIECSENDVFYGYFWQDIPYQIGIDIANGKIARPDAVVCHSDHMALGLCRGLRDGGIFVPDDIAVTGFDGNWFSFVYEPTITTVVGVNRQHGEAAIATLWKMITGVSVDCSTSPQLFIQKSCGCHSPIHSEVEFLMKYMLQMTTQYFSRKNFITADYMTNITASVNMQELISNISAYRELLSTARHIDICICDEFDDSYSDMENYRHSGFSDHVKLFYTDRETSLTSHFNIRQILPVIDDVTTDGIFVFTSFFRRDRILGYAVTEYDSVGSISIDEFYINWLDGVANGFMMARERRYRQFIENQIMHTSIHDPSTGFLNVKGIIEAASVLNPMKKYGLLLIAFKEQSENAKFTGYEYYQLLANAIRASTDNDNLCARLQSKIFCILLEISEKSNGKEELMQRLLDVQKNIHYFGSGVQTLFKSELVTDQIVIENGDLIYFDRIITKAMQALCIRLDGETFQYTSLTEKLYELHQDIYLHPEKDRDIKSLAKEMNISEGYFYHLYKSEFAISCIDDVINARLQKARQLLTSTKMKIYEIALNCGYHNERHFVRQFKQFVGATPTEYRKKLSDKHTG